MCRKSRLETELWMLPIEGSAAVASVPIGLIGNAVISSCHRHFFRSCCSSFYSIFILETCFPVDTMKPAKSYCLTSSKPPLKILLSEMILITFLFLPSSLPFGFLLSSLPGPSHSRKGAKRPARRTQFGKGDGFTTVYFNLLCYCFFRRLESMFCSCIYSCRLLFSEKYN